MAMAMANSDGDGKGGGPTQMGETDGTGGDGTWAEGTGGRGGRERERDRAQTSAHTRRRWRRARRVFTLPPFPPDGALVRPKKEEKIKKENTKHPLPPMYTPRRCQRRHYAACKCPGIWIQPGARGEREGGRERNHTLAVFSLFFPPFLHA